MSTWDAIVFMGLIYTAIVTPFEVALVESGFGFLFCLNRCVDLIFWKDMFMQFFLKVKVGVPNGQSSWVRNKRDIRLRYLKSWFLLDFFSVLPFDVIALVSDDPATQNLMAFRLIRLLRLLKLLRMLRASRILVRWEMKIAISYTSQAF